MIDKACESGAGTFRRREAQGKAASDNATRLFRPFSMLGGAVPPYRDRLRRYARRYYEAPLEGRCVGDPGVDLVR